MPVELLRCRSGAHVRATRYVAGGPASSAMAPLLTVHALTPLIAAAIAGNAILAVWAFVAQRRQRRVLGRAFWVLLLLVVGVLAVQMAAGVLLAVAGARPKASLHFLYAVLVTAGAVAQFGLRPGGFLRAAVVRDSAQFSEPRYLALICFTEAALIARAYMTGAFGH